MSTRLSPPSPGDTRSDVADWLELQVLFSRRGIATKSTLSNAWDIAEDGASERLSRDEETGEIVDEAIVEDKWNEQVSAAFDEIHYRAETLKATYPFTSDPRALSVRRDPSVPVTEPGHIVYLFCLLASAIRQKWFQPDAALEAATLAIADNFQICAGLAAGGYVCGPAAWFGFPRPDGTGFLAALKSVYGRFGSGEPRTSVPAGLPTREKDGGIDVIAWRDFADRLGGKTYILGQCASGKNWKGKSVLEYIGQLHGSWFTMAPATYALPALFTVFPAHHELQDSAQETFESKRSNNQWHEEKRYGIIFDRLRVAEFAHVCLTSGEVPRNHIDGVTLFPNVKEWLYTTATANGLEFAA